jgi:hypothetical protein
MEREVIKAEGATVGHWGSLLLAAGSKRLNQWKGRDLDETP